MWWQKPQEKVWIASHKWNTMNHLQSNKSQNSSALQIIMRLAARKRHFLHNKKPCACLFHKAQVKYKNVEKKFCEKTLQLFIIDTSAPISGENIIQHIFTTRRPFAMIHTRACKKQCKQNPPETLISFFQKMKHAGGTSN